MSKTNYRKMYDKNNQKDNTENIENTESIEEKKSQLTELEDMLYGTENTVLYDGYSKAEGVDITPPTESIEVTRISEDEEDSDSDIEEAVNDNVETEIETEIETEQEQSYKSGTVIDCVGLNVRKEPSLQSEIVHVLSVDEKIKIIGEDGEFYKINVFKIEGYCLKKYISIEE